MPYSTATSAPYGNSFFAATRVLSGIFDVTQGCYAHD
ncbi:hypothetical protein JOM49_006751 [Amycolatopsis magusensis]|uniref:Uncharacterized protein n=1 Tax=Amycolatopsis magusensis TaxID=882444 RepID=A0ABS4Q286_9PSEU|nr:hypothetical protein [Amycolatopsis magusensis]